MIYEIIICMEFIIHFGTGCYQILCEAGPQCVDLSPFLSAKGDFHNPPSKLDESSSVYTIMTTEQVVY